MKIRDLKNVDYEYLTKTVPDSDPDLNVETLLFRWVSNILWYLEKPKKYLRIVSICNRIKNLDLKFDDNDLNDLYKFKVRISIDEISFDNILINGSKKIVLSCPHVEIIISDSKDLEDFIFTFERSHAEKSRIKPEDDPDEYVANLIEEHCEPNDEIEYKDNCYTLECENSHILFSLINNVQGAPSRIDLYKELQLMCYNYAKRITDEITFDELADVADQIRSDITDFAADAFIKKYSIVSDELIPDIVNIYEEILNKFLGWLDEKSN